ncbi:MAG: cache and HAMP domain-containing protein [Bacteroidales bacterium]|nr:cache and HAMP domain-containing protein [Bacteroidales bacterium]
MPRDFIPKTVAARIIFRTVLYVAVLLALTILAMTIGMRITINEETGRQADLTLEGVTCRIDNTFLGVEQTAHIIKGDIPFFLESPQKLLQLCREAIKANPDISGCAIALNPDYYTVGGKPFMAYIYRSGELLVSSETFTSRPFTQQEWFTKPLIDGTPSWVGPLKNDDTEEEPIISYDVPILDDGRTVGVLGVDVSLGTLTEIAQQYRTTSHSYIIILDEDGSYIVHPDSTKLLSVNSMSNFRDTEDPAIMETIREMVAGKTGKTTFTLDSVHYYAAYMPFQQSALPGRQVNSLGWSIAVVYPQNELISQYDPGFRYTILIILAGILLLVIGANVLTRISLKPLRKLTYVSRSVASGNYLSTDFDTTRTDEVGRLQALFNKMQNSISDHMERLMDLSRKEESRREALAITYAKTKEAEKHRSTILGKMTHKMVDVTTDLYAGVEKLYESGGVLDGKELKQILESIDSNGLKVTEILSEMLNVKK